MNPVLTFSIGLALLILFFWYFATDQGMKKRLIATALLLTFVLFSLATIYPPREKIVFGLDIQGGTSFLIRLQQVGERELTSDMLDQAVEVIRKRVDDLGGAEPVITPVGTDRILVQVPGIGADRIQDARTRLSRVARLEFAMVHPQSDELIRKFEAGEGILPPDYRRVTYSLEGRKGEKIEEQLLIRKRPDLTGDRVRSAFASFQNEWQVNLEFDSEGAKKFDELAAAHFQERFAILLDGEVQSAPSINARYFGGRATISGGRMGEDEARQLASVLENPLQTPVSIEEERSVSPTLGRDSIQSSVLAGIVGLLITMVCVLAYYRLLGLIANLVLIVNLLMLLGALTMFNFVLTLPGVAGIILTIGMAVDANVLIYERLREEQAMGKSLRTSLEAGYDKAFSSIFDANVTTLITAIILFWQATGPVRGFAITLTLGIIASMFSVLIVARNASTWLVEAGKVKRLSMMSLVPSLKFDFMKRGGIATLASVVVLVIAGTVFYMRGERNFGVDFRGGDLLTMSADRVVPLSDLRRSLEPLNLADATIQESEQAGRAYITVRSAMGTSDAISARLREAFPDDGLRPEGAERVGPLVGAELARRSLIALGLGMIGILIYVTFRFELSFAIGAIVAVLHDVLMTVGIFALLDRELSLTLVGAILTIAGYSINDTIVVFDRIREGLTSGRRGTTAEIMNASINQTLSRTILTGMTTLIPLTCLFLFGGTVLRDFALAIIVGVLVGTYSSIFIASPIVLWWSRMRSGSTGGLRREVKESATPANA